MLQKKQIPPCLLQSARGKGRTDGKTNDQYSQGIQDALSERLEQASEALSKSGKI
jgi:hypothetical protein